MGKNGAPSQSKPAALPALPKGELNSLSQNLTVLPAPSWREPLAWRQSFRHKCKACGSAISSPFGGAGERSETERVGSLPEGAGAAQAASEGVNACQHNICPNLSAPAPGKTTPPGQGKDDSVNCRQTLFRNIPELQQIPLVFILFNENASGSLAIFPIDKTVRCRI